MSRRLSIPADVQNLAAVRAFVRTSVTDLGGSQRAADDLVQAVDEVACNVMLHGYGGKPGEVEIEIEALVEEQQLEVRILDRAPVFDPTAAPAVDTSLPPVSKRPGTMGVGIHLARTMTDEVRHDVRPGGGNALTLVRSIEARTEED
ncbi:MAG TPA: ATP-binding protein [Candidatus Limnocylindria bacterium]|nr:ATP-binding protein [Candidatus Limnocylindria bacterium]